MRKRKLISLFMTSILSISLLNGCGYSSDKKVASIESNNIKEFSAFFAVPGKELPSDNRIKNKIAEKIGAKIDEQWLTGQTSKERVGVMVAGGDYPDFIDGADGTQTLIDAGALIPLDEYIDKYPNIKNYFTESEWKHCKSKDGHIYIIPEFCKVQGKETSPTYSGEAFWIQKRVLEWANYPTIKTLDEYFDLIERYKEANPVVDGQPTIGFEILCDDWRYFCLENPPQFLAGYPNDGKAIVDKDTLKAHIYDTIPEAKSYYKKLGEEYAKGIIDPEAFTTSYDQYLSKLSSGNVLGMIDQGWDFDNAKNELAEQGKEDRTWVPLGLTIDQNVKPHYRSKTEINGGSGLGITISCKDVDGALKVINDLLDPEVVALRSWGEKNIDYEVDENGKFYKTDEQRQNSKDQNWVNKNMCAYSYFPSFKGMQADGINTVLPDDQIEEFYATLTDTDKRILDAYGYKTFTEFLNVPDEENSPWFPIYSFTNTLTGDSKAGIAHEKMDDIKKMWLPKVIMTEPDKFEEIWEEYTNTLISNADIKAFEDANTEEVQRRVREFN